ncbi:hypothetical protein HZC09_03115 [Candidatus Micrarchaeota archaeon]|nr:hypothetical protein [Candidatus Micrarchaeota archaeon]
MPEPERVDQLVKKLAGLPEDLRPFIDSVLITRFAAHFEATHDENLSDRAWQAHAELMKEELQNPDQEGVFQRALLLATLPKHHNPEVEKIYGWLRGNGLTVLQGDAMRDRLISHLDNSTNGGALARALDQYLSIDVQHVTTANDLWEPEPYNLFVALLVCRNAESRKPKDPMGENRQCLWQKAVERVVDPNTWRSMSLFDEIPGTKDLYGKLQAWLRQLAE